MGVKLHEAVKSDGTHYALQFYCPPCAESHMVTPGWTWNGSTTSPTFTPSVKVTYLGEDEGVAIETVCHFHVTDGRIAYCADCTHAMAGQTVDLPDWDSVRNPY